jgi:TP901 family phage tail tape measure protein
VTDKQEIGIELWAKDNASPTVSRLIDVFEKLRSKVESVADDMASQTGFTVPIKALENAIKHAETSIPQQFDRIGNTTDAAAARIILSAKQVAEQEERLATKTAQKQIDEAERALKGQALAAQRAANESIAAGERALKNEALSAQRRANESIAATQKIAAAERRSAGQTAELVEKTNQDALKAEALAAQRRADIHIKGLQEIAAAERKSAGETAWIAQQANDKLVADAKRAADATARAHAAGAGGGGGGGFGGGGFGGFGGFLGGAAGGGRNMLEGLLSAGGKLGSAVLAPLRAVGGAVESLVGHFNNAASSMGQMIAIGLGFISLYEIVNTVERAFAHIYTTLTGFQDKMVQVQSLTEGSNENIRDLGAGVLEASMKTGQSAIELGQAMFFIESHGIKGAAALELLNQAAMLAASGLGTTDQIVRVVAGQMRQYGAGIEETTHFMDVFARTEQLSSLPIGELSKQMSRITPLAAALHVPVEQVGAAIAAISRSGLPASRVMTDLIAVFTQLIKTTPKQVEALEGMGTSIDEVREKLTKDGFFESLSFIWEKSGHDIDAVGKVFGDTSRALIGYLALVQGSSEDWKIILDDMANSAGTVARVFEANQVRISLQVARSQAIFEAYGMVVSQDVLPGVAEAWRRVNDALAAGNVAGAWDALVKGAKDAGTGITTVLGNIAKDMFGAGANIVGQLAQGMWDSATNILNQVVNAIADLIASFLLGASPPKAGPLHYINQGVTAWNKEYANAMNSNAGIMAGAAANVAGVVNGELAKIGAVGAAGSAAGIQAQIHAIEDQLLPWQQATDTIKDHYEAMLHPLERQIASIEHIKNLEYERKQLVFEQRDMELQMLKLRAEGDPAKRAQLAGQMAKATEIREQHSIDQQIASLNRRLRTLKPGKGVSAGELALERRGIQDELSILNIQRQQHALTNSTLMGQYAAGKAKLDYDQAGAKLANDAFELQKKQTLQPLIEQRDKIKTQMQAELDYISAQTDGLNDQKKVLEHQLKLIQDRERGSKGAGGIGSHPLVLDPVELEGEGKIGKAITALSNGMAETLKRSLQGGMETFWKEKGPGIGQVAIGFIVGGMVGGMPGAVIGAAFVPKLIDALSERGITGADFSRFANSFMASLRDTFTRMSVKLQAGDILGTVEELMVSVRAWVAKFSESFFREWNVTTTPGVKGAASNDILSTIRDYSQTSAGQAFADANIGGSTTTRYTGLGRQILEGMSGGIIAEKLDFSDLDKAIRSVFTRIGEHLTSPTIVSTDAAGEQTLGPSIVDRMFQQIGESIVSGMRNLASGIREATPGASAGAYSAGSTLAGLIFGSMEDELNQPQDTLLASASRAGFAIGGSFLAGFASALPVIGGIVEFGQWLNSIKTPGIANEALTGQANVLRSGPPKPALGQYQAPVSAEGFMPDKKLGGDAANGILEGFRDAWENDSSFKEDVGRFWTVNLIDPTMERLDMNTPSRVFQEIGEGVIEGFGNAFSQDRMTGATVRTWLRSEVLAQARDILLEGEGKSGGLSGVAQTALDGFVNVFATPPAQLEGNLRAFGQSIVDDIMDPIKDPRTGVVAQMRRVIDSIPTAKPGAGTTLPTPDAGARYAATGADFVVGGSGGTDSEHINLWATPGERVQVGAGGRSGRQVSVGNINISVTSNNADEVREAIAQGIQQGLGDSEGEVPSQLLNAWRTAKAQGATRPIGTQSRGARG